MNSENTKGETRHFKVGDTLRCLQYVERRDRESHLDPGDIVKVTHEFKFNYQGKVCQDITVQKGHDAPIAVIVEPGRFAPSTPHDR